MFLQVDRFPLTLGNIGGKKIHPFIWMIKIQTLFSLVIIKSTAWVVQCFYRVAEVQHSATMFLQDVLSLLLFMVKSAYEPSAPSSRRLSTVSVA